MKLEDYAARQPVAERITERRDALVNFALDTVEAEGRGGTHAFVIARAKTDLRNALDKLEAQPWTT